MGVVQGALCPAGVVVQVGPGTPVCPPFVTLVTALSIALPLPTVLFPALLLPVALLVAVLERVATSAVVPMLVAPLCLSIRWHGFTSKEGTASRNGLVDYRPQG